MARPRRDAQIPELLQECESVCDTAAVFEARGALPGVRQTHQLADLFSALADPTRVRIVAALDGREMCVGDIAATLGLSQSATSHQLRALRGQGLVQGTRRGRMMYYALDDEHVSLLFRQGLEHVDHLTEAG
ncbi:MAG TPA: metalloregulator ArsR/SmtB family transcription factor [Thermomicrobiales bacterium]|nr:metalloregulator ArsR/SmtB family transcription factor [Thermomicrobiales bacterium]